MIAMWKAASPEERTEFIALFAPAAAPEKPKAARAKVVKMSVPLPEGIPTAEDYRLTEIDASVCVGRKLGEKDMRFRPFVYREAQCGAALVEGSDLCSRCGKNETKYAAEPKPGAWTGRVVEDPLDWVHMLGTTWAEDKKPKFTSGPSDQASTTADAPASAKFTSAQAPSAPADTAPAEAAFSSSSSSSSPAPAPAQAPAPAPAPAPPAPAKADAKAAAKEAEKAQKAAAKEAEKAQKAAAKAATAAAEKAAKEKIKADAAAAKEKVKAEAAAAKAAKAPPAKAAAPAPAEAKVSAPAPAPAPAAVDAQLKLIDGTLYMIKGQNVYEYDELTEKAGDFVGLLTEEDTINTDGEEVVVAESESE
jgi:hypothetical protein